MEDRIRRNEGADQTELFPEEQHNHGMVPLAISILAVLGIVIGLFIFLAPAHARPVHTHACMQVETANKLADWVAVNGMENYQDEVQQYLDSGACHLAVVDAPSPNPPVYLAVGEVYMVGVYIAYHRGRPSYVLMLGLVPHKQDTAI